MPANLVFRRKIWGARDNGIPPRSTPDVYLNSYWCVYVPLNYLTCEKNGAIEMQHNNNSTLISYNLSRFLHIFTHVLYAFLYCALSISM